MMVIPECGRWRREGQRFKVIHPLFCCCEFEFVASLGCMRLCFNLQQNKTKAAHVGAHHEVSPVETGARRTVCVG